MSEEVNEKFKQIADVIGQKDMAENIKNLLGLLANSDSKENSPSKDTDEEKRKNEANKLVDNVDMIRKVTKMMNQFNSIKDSRINLLQAIKPFLNPRRQSKLDNCVNILRMSHLAKIANVDEKGRED